MGLSHCAHVAWPDPLTVRVVAEIAGGGLLRLPCNSGTRGGQRLLWVIALKKGLAGEGAKGRR
jgi:hypothetical protein